MKKLYIKLHFFIKKNHPQTKKEKVSLYINYFIYICDKLT
jgi:hypothetical protein